MIGHVSCGGLQGWRIVLGVAVLSVLPGCALSTSASEGAATEVDDATGASEQAASPNGCWGSGGSHTDYVGGSYGTRYCKAYRGGNVVFSGKVRGYLNAGTSWFVCQSQWPGYNNPQVGSAQNNWWLYTQADTGNDANHGWGWFPATHVSGGKNWSAVPGLRDCGEIPGFPSSTP